MKLGTRCAVLRVFLFVCFVLDLHGRVKADGETGAADAVTTAAAEVPTTTGPTASAENPTTTGPAASAETGESSAVKQDASTDGLTTWSMADKVVLSRNSWGSPEHAPTTEPPAGKGDMWSAAKKETVSYETETNMVSQTTDIIWDEKEKNLRIRQEVVGFALEMQHELKSRVALIKWLQSDDKYGPKYQHYRGFYYTVGAFVTQRAIVCTPSNEVEIKMKSVNNWYVHHLYVGLTQSIPVNITAKDFTLYFHPRFKMSLDSSHRIALILLNDDGWKIAQNAYMRPTPMVGNPLMSANESIPLENYAVAKCNLIVFGVYEPSMQRRMVSIPFAATPCVFLNEVVAKFASKICGFTRMTKTTVDLMSHRYEYPNDLGAPLFCHNYFVGMYSGIQNIAGNRSRSFDFLSKVDFSPALDSRRLEGDEQHTFEVPGHEKNLNFIFGIDSEDPKAKWVSKMPVAEDPCVSISPPTIQPKNVKTTPPTTQGQVIANGTVPTQEPTDSNSTKVHSTLASDGTGSPGESKPDGQSTPGQDKPVGQSTPGQDKPDGQSSPGQDKPGGQGSPGESKPDGQGKPDGKEPGQGGQGSSTQGTVGQETPGKGAGGQESSSQGSTGGEAPSTQSTANDANPTSTATEAP